MRTTLLAWTLAAGLLMGRQATADPVPRLAPVDLDHEQGLAVKVASTGFSVFEYLGAVSKQTGKAFVVLGDFGDTRQTLLDLKGKTAREAMQLLATKVKGDWQSYGAFYLLRPRDFTQMGRTRRGFR